ncbi:protransforming growth factor alpha [Pimephales promelas]|nr:protransforming growth factor alpha [Pimephales promelas]
MNPPAPCRGYRVGPVFHGLDENCTVPPESELQYPGIDLSREAEKCDPPVVGTHLKKRDHHPAPFSHMGRYKRILPQQRPLQPPQQLPRLPQQPPAARRQPLLLHVSEVSERCSRAVDIHPRCGLLQSPYCSELHSRLSNKFIAAAVHSHFDDCPDTHSHFCFHGTCRFLILEETPACVCHPGFMGMRCEHADLLAVVASNHRQQTVATMLVLCVVGSVLLMLLCTLLNGLTCIIWSYPPPYSWTVFHQLQTHTVGKHSAY